jgi:hypothetical protein
MSELSVTKITDRVGTGKVNFSQGFKVAGTLDTTLAPTRTEGNTEPETPVNGDTWYDTDNDTYDVYINDEWKRFLGAGGGGTIDISNATYDSVSFSVASEESSPRNLAFNADGTKMYIVGTSSDSVHQYSLSTAYDLSTASYDSVSFSVASQETNPIGLTFNTDGTKMYIVGFINDTVYQYNLSTGFNLSTASYGSVSFSVASQETAPLSLTFNADGTKMYIVGNTNDSVYQYSLSTGFNVSTASYDSVSFSVTSQDNAPCAIAFNTDGTKMFLMGQQYSTVYQYTLSTGFDLSTASYDSSSFSVNSQETSPSGLAFNNDLTKMYIAGFINDSVFQYSTGL